MFPTAPPRRYEPRQCCQVVQHPDIRWRDCYTCKQRSGPECHGADEKTCSKMNGLCEWDKSIQYCRANPLLDDRQNCVAQTNPFNCLRKGCLWSDKHETCYYKHRFARAVRCRDDIVAEVCREPRMSDITRPRGRFNSTNEIERCKIYLGGAIHPNHNVSEMGCETRYARREGCKTATPENYAKYCEPWRRRGWRAPSDVTTIGQLLRRQRANGHARPLQHDRKRQ